jgi:hypothetical protein
MSHGRLCILILASMLIEPASGNGAGIEVELAPPQQTVNSGDTPRFVVTVRANAGEHRVMKFAERSDLRINYAELIVTAGGKQVQVPRVIADPGPTSDEDYVALGPGRSMTFEHDGQPYRLSALKPGSYSATVKLRADWRVAPVMSNVVSFTVVQR